MSERIKEMDISLREATTRYMNILCKTEDGKPFNFNGYTTQTYIAFGQKNQYVQNTIVENLLSYKIPANLSLGANSGVAETRIFNGADVFEVLRVNISVFKAEKPDIEPPVG